LGMLAGGAAGIESCGCGASIGLWYRGTWPEAVPSRIPKANVPVATPAQFDSRRSPTPARVISDVFTATPFANFKLFLFRPAGASARIRTGFPKPTRLLGRTPPASRYRVVPFYRRTRSHSACPHAAQTSETCNPKPLDRELLSSPHVGGNLHNFQHHSNFSDAFRCDTSYGPPDILNLRMNQGPARSRAFCFYQRGSS